MTCIVSPCLRFSEFQYTLYLFPIVKLNLGEAEHRNCYTSVLTLMFGTWPIFYSIFNKQGPSTITDFLPNWIISDHILSYIAYARDFTGVLSSLFILSLCNSFHETFWDDIALSMSLYKCNSVNQRANFSFNLKRCIVLFEERISVGCLNISSRILLWKENCSWQCVRI